LAPRPRASLAKSDYFTGTGIGGRVRRGFFEGIGAVPVDRHSSRAAQESLDAALGVVRAGRGFGIYPEGTRSRDGRLYKGRTGVAWLALTSGAPVVPVALTGTQTIQPPGSSRIHLAKVTVEFGVPVVHAGSADSGRDRRRVTDDIM